MTSEQVVLFGSFSEDEAAFFQSSSSGLADSKPTSNGHLPSPPALSQLLPVPVHNGDPLPHPSASTFPVVSSPPLAYPNGPSGQGSGLPRFGISHPPAGVPFFVPDGLGRESGEASIRQQPRLASWPPRPLPSAVVPIAAVRNAWPTTNGGFPPGQHMPPPMAPNVVSGHHISAYHTVHPTPHAVHGPSNHPAGYAIPLQSDLISEKYGSPPSVNLIPPAMGIRVYPQPAPAFAPIIAPTHLPVPPSGGFVPFPPMVRPLIAPHGSSAPIPAPSPHSLAPRAAAAVSPVAVTISSSAPPGPLADKPSQGFVPPAEGGESASTAGSQDLVQDASRDNGAFDDLSTQSSHSARDGDGKEGGRSDTRLDIEKYHERIAQHHAQAGGAGSTSPRPEVSGGTPALMHVSPPPILDPAGPADALHANGVTHSEADSPLSSEDAISQAERSEIRPTPSEPEATTGELAQAETAAAIVPSLADLPSTQTAAKSGEQESVPEASQEQPRPDVKKPERTVSTEAPPQQAPPAPKSTPKSWAALVGTRNAPSLSMEPRHPSAAAPRVQSPSSSTGGSPAKSTARWPQGPTSASSAPSADGRNGMQATQTNSQEGVSNVDPGQTTSSLNGEAWLKSLREAEVSKKLRLQPRGLLNAGNTCFLNSTLQGLLSCTPFVHLLQTVVACKIPPTGYPVLRAFADFIQQFQLVPESDSPLGPDAAASKGNSGGAEVDVGQAFTPTMFDDVLNKFSPNNHRPGMRKSRQEDAQEFLSFVMDRMHEELVQLEGRVRGAAAQTSEGGSEGGSPGLEFGGENDDEWETVGPKNKTAVTRTHTVVESAMSDIFGGQLRSVVKTKGNKASATVQPFLLLQLDISSDSVHTLEDALARFTAPETLDGYKAKAGKAEVVVASKAVQLAVLPRVLILHLMRFSYGAEGMSKLHKPVRFPALLTLQRDLLASVASTSLEARRYELVATVSHHGKDPSGGHYTADVKQTGGSTWLRFDDATVQPISQHRALHDQAYLLVYKRLSM